MASEPYGDVWGDYLGQLQRQKAVPGEGYMEWLRRNPNATHDDFERVFGGGKLTPIGFMDIKKRFQGQEMIQEMQPPPWMKGG